MSLTSQYPHIEDIVAYRGDDWSLGTEREFFDANGSLGMVQTTGWTARMQIRDTKDATTVKATATVLTGQVDSRNTNGRIRMSLTKAQMATFADGYVGYYDLETVDTAGRQRTWLSGRFIVNGDVTRV